MIGGEIALLWLSPSFPMGRVVAELPLVLVTSWNCLNYFNFEP